MSVLDSVFIQHAYTSFLPSSLVVSTLCCRVILRLPVYRSKRKQTDLQSMTPNMQTHDNDWNTTLTCKSAAWSGMFINRLKSPTSAHRQYIFVWCLGYAWDIHGKTRLYHEELTEHIFFTLQVSFTSPRTAEVSIIAINSAIPHNLCNNFFLLLFFFLYVYRDPATAPEQTTNWVSLCYEPWCPNHYVYDP